MPDRHLHPALALALLIAATPAMAQAPEPEAAAAGTAAPIATLPRIGVSAPATAPLGATASASATKTDTPILESPQSVSVVSRALIEALGAQTLPEAVRYNAGVTTGVYGFDPRFDQIFIRGFPVNLLGDYRDGLRQSFSPGLIGFRTEPYGLDRIVILRGPSSVLYGQAPAGGLIDRISRMPSATPSSEVAVSVGSHSRYQTEFDSTGPIAGDPRFQYRITGVVRDSDSEIPRARDDRFYLAPSLTFRPTENTSVTLLTSILDDRGVASAGYYTRPDGTPTNIRTDDPNFARFDQRQYQIGYRLEHRVNDTFSLRQNMRYSQATLTSAYLGGGVTSADGTSVSRSANFLEESLENVGIDNQAEWRFATGPLQHTLLAGVDYQYTTSDFNYGFGPAPALSLVNPVYDINVARPAFTTRSSQTQHQIGVYAQDQIRLGDRWVLTMGARQDWTETDSENRVTGVTTTQTPNAFTGRMGLVHLFPNGIAPYVNYAESFQPTLGTDRLGQAFVPVEAAQIEAGLRYQPPGTEHLFTASAFEITVQNGTTTDPVDRNFSVQTGEQRSRGLELEAQFAVNSQLRILASATWQDVEITKSNGADLGKRPIGVPEVLGTIWADYRMPEGPLSGLSLGAGLRYNGPSYQNAANTSENSDYVMLDGAVRYDVGRWRLSLNGTNLTDRQAYNCQSGYCYHVAGRTVLARLGYRF
ncbi:TonB-dependent siderophore receptor [Falsiroseomonas tokyonensis]|uniref:TonB-dependent siderophore receptor n=1 Tax=Falsiroseomonas tokyonensis TaxID=430521 RepID=A0ABV7C1B9_9PROT|nr:TonB-dependent siderophore receptor [Falsiroseomonas tokyonensis]MBU8540464.1 TonB-dependent siderophore receptor [Falsiroseomonas tokyonensis]